MTINNVLIVLMLLLFATQIKIAFPLQENLLYRWSFVGEINLHCLSWFLQFRLFLIIQCDNMTAALKVDWMDEYKELPELLLSRELVLLPLQCFSWNQWDPLCKPGKGKSNYKNNWTIRLSALTLFTITGGANPPGSSCVIIVSRQLFGLSFNGWIIFAAAKTICIHKIIYILKFMSLKRIEKDEIT